MRVQSDIRRNVMFLGTEENNQFIPKGTGFLVRIAADPHGSFLYLVTAMHVIERLRSINGDHLLVRHNTEGGSKISRVKMDAWHFHPNIANEAVDIAVALIDGTLLENWLAADQSVLLSKEGLLEAEFGVGDEIVIVGLFRNHAGKKQNIPIVRVGHLAALPEEPVSTRSGELDAYLVEALSIGGLSGSPVWIHPLPFRVQNNQIQHATGNRLRLLGLISGHFDVPSLNEDTVVDDLTGGALNTGIAVVSPAHRILEILNKTELAQHRAAVLAALESTKTKAPPSKIGEQSV